jgi:anti-anti-sigma factor
MRPEARVIQITPRGDYDQATAGWLVQRVEHALEEGATAVVIDLGELAFGGSTLISDIIRSRGRCAEHGVAFGLSAESAHWHRLFRIAGVSYLLDPEDE